MNQPLPHPPAANRPHPRLNTGDMLWLRWVLLCTGVLCCVAILMTSGIIAELNTAHTALLQGAPLRLAPEAGEAALLSPAMAFACCIPLTLYWAAVMMQQRTFRHRAELTLPAVAALVLPGIICVLWDCVLHTAAMICSVLLTWLFVVCIPFFRSAQA